MKANLFLKSIFGLMLLCCISLHIIGCFDNCHTCNCSDSGKTYYEHEPVKVDLAIFQKDTVSSSESLKIFFWGNIGSDSCHSFGYFQASSSAHQTDIVVYGALKKIWCSEPVCNPANINLNGVSYTISSLVAGPYTVVIHQPDGSTLTKYAYVR